MCLFLAHKLPRSCVTLDFGIYNISAMKSGQRSHNGYDIAVEILQNCHDGALHRSLVGAGYTPQQVLTSSTEQWMMVDKSAVSLDGTTCNKVGTSYTAFQYQNVRAIPSELSARCMPSGHH